MQGGKLREIEWTPPKNLRPFSWLPKPYLKSMARGSGLEKQDERLAVSPQRHSPVPREWDVALSSGGKPLVK